YSIPRAPADALTSLGSSMTNISLGCRSMVSQFWDLLTIGIGWMMTSHLHGLCSESELCRAGCVATANLRSRIIVGLLCAIQIRLQHRRRRSDLGHSLPRSQRCSPWRGSADSRACAREPAWVTTPSLRTMPTWDLMRRYVDTPFSAKVRRLVPMQ